MSEIKIVYTRRDPDRTQGGLLVHALDEDRPTQRPHFPDQLKGITW